jgi:alpha-glucosidase
MTIVSYSPLQSVFWYDKPSAFHDEPEIRWFEQVPTVWDDTHVITGEIGKYAALARRSGRSWFVGVVNGNESRSLDLPLTFLPNGRRYQMDIYTDDPAVPTQTHIAVKTQIVTSATVLTLPLQAAGGAAMHLTPLP